MSTSQPAQIQPGAGNPAPQAALVQDFLADPH